MRILALLSLFIVCCGCTEQPRIPANPPAIGIAENAIANTPVAHSDFEFCDPLLRARFQQLDATARQLAVPDWHVEPYHKVSSGMFERSQFEAQWSSHRPDRGLGIPRATMGFETHYVRLTTESRREQPLLIRGLRMSASWTPPWSGWAAHVTYAVARKQTRPAEPVGSFAITFTDVKDVFSGGNRIVLAVDTGSDSVAYQDTQQFDGIT
jgi:hypothetical protein